MPAGFHSLCDQDVGAGSNRLLRVVDAANGTEQLRAGPMNRCGIRRRIAPEGIDARRTRCQGSRNVLVLL